MDDANDLAAKSTWAGMCMADCAQMLLAAVALGWTVVENQHVQAFAAGQSCPLVYHCPATQVKCEVELTEGFAAKHRRLAALFINLGRATGTTWQVRTVDDHAKQHPDQWLYRIADFKEAFQFSRRVRRVRHTRTGVCGDLFNA